MNRLSIRPISDPEWDAYYRVDQEAFHTAPSPESGARWRRMAELDRSLAVFDGPELVGTAGACSFTMTVPGGPTAVAGVTAVAVLTSHRRRGILTMMMERQLNDLHEGREPLAALYASQSTIYGRFGYGRACDTLAFDIPRHATAYAPGTPSDPSLRLRVAFPAEARKEFASVYETAMLQRPGLYARSPARWDDVLADDEHARSDGGPLRCVIAEDDGGPRGYALFRVKEGHSPYDLPEAELHLADLHATDPAAYAFTWRGVLDRDLIGRIRAWSRPVDDPLIHLLAEPRGLRAIWSDDLWVRVVDVDRAMALRAYSAAVDVVMDVRDTRCPWNARRWRLSADGSGAVCEPTSAPADLSLTVNVLGSAYLGGQPLAPFLSSGAITEHTPGATARLSTAMSWEPRPWAGRVF